MKALSVDMESIVRYLKQGCFLIVGEQKGKSEIWRLVLMVCSRSSQVFGLVGVSPSVHILKMICQTIMNEIGGF